MAKLIRLTPEYIASLREEFESAIAGIKLSDGKFTFSKSFGNVSRRATVYFTEMAWEKMQCLIREFDKEVAWHGIAKRGDDPEKDEYIISDILVYPQEVTAATVTTDQSEYQSWLYSEELEDVFNDIRMQGHSHVNMSTSPSGVDTNLYSEILEQLEGDMFYIFMIYNKRGEKTYKIYDLAKNVLFETADVTVKIMSPNFDVDAFLSGAKAMVKTHTVQSQTWKSPYAQPSTPKPYTPPASTQPAASQKKEEPKKHEPQKGSGASEVIHMGKRKGKRKKDEKKQSYGGYTQFSSPSYAGIDDDDLYDDGPYSAFGYSNHWY